MSGIGSMRVKPRSALTSRRRSSNTTLSTSCSTSVGTVTEREWNSALLAFGALMALLLAATLRAWSRGHVSIRAGLILLAVGLVLSVAIWKRSLGAFSA